MHHSLCLFVALSFKIGRSPMLWSMALMDEFRFPINSPSCRVLIAMASTNQQILHPHGASSCLGWAVDQRTKCRKDACRLRNSVCRNALPGV
jgi:hypothetical protein